MKNQPLLHSGSLSNSRRQFLEKVGFVAVMGTFGISFFTSCVSTEEPSDATPPQNSSSNDGITISGSTIQINLAVQTKLASSGGWLLVGAGKTLVANLDGAFVAMTSVCTHSGCFDSWSFTNNRFTCTCHNSIFDTAGQVLQGPATKALQVYTTSVSGTTLTVNK